MVFSAWSPQGWLFINPDLSGSLTMIEILRRTAMGNQKDGISRTAGMFLIGALAAVACTQQPVAEKVEVSETGAEQVLAARPDQIRVPGRNEIPIGDPVMAGVEVASYVEDVAVERTAPQSGFEGQLTVREVPLKARPKPRGQGYPMPEEMAARRAEGAPAGRTRSGFTGRGSEAATPADSLELNGPIQTPTPGAGNGLPFLVADFDSTNFDSNASTTGFFTVPPDPHVAAGTSHVMTVVNTSLQVFTKNGAVQRTQSLRNFFAPLAPLTGTFDPKVLYDSQANRWVVVTLEQTDKAFGSAANTSRVFVAASDDADPAGTWFMTAIDARTMVGGRDHWADYPGFGVDEEAIYITTNLFSFADTGGFFGGVRLWILPKGPLYNGQTVNVRRVDPYAAAGFALTTMPAQMYGNSSGVGGLLLGYSGLNDGTNAFVQVMRINNPLGAIQVAGPEFVNLGAVDDLCCALPGAAQQGAGETVMTNDRRMLNAVWINGRAYGTFTLRRNSRAAVHWVELNTSAAASISRQATITGQEIGGSVHTFFPSVAANDRGDVMVGYAASGPSIFPGAYYSIYASGDDISQVREPQTLRAGLGPYVRRFGPANRYGDYTGTVVDPVDGCFWVFNQYAGAPGTPLGNTGTGRWNTAAGKVCLALGFGQQPDVEGDE